jgi:DNA-binding response OmpR family regulator
VIKILVVEDDADLRDLTAYMLRRERFAVIEAGDGAEALRRWKAERPDLVVLDLGLPGIDGLNVLQVIRARDNTPILVLTGRTGTEDRLRSFNLGSDDFLAKPFEFRELTARIRAILRRTKGSSYDETEVPVQRDGLRLVPETSEVQWRDACVRLTPTEFRILHVLVTNAGHVVSAHRLYTYVWGGDGADANALRTHISHIRRKLTFGSDPPAKITSVPAVGYIFGSSARAATAVPQSAGASAILSVSSAGAAPHD